MELINRFLSNYQSIFMVDFKITDLLEILILSFLIYQFMNWIKRTRAYTLLKGILFMLAFIFIAYIFNMNTIFFLAQNAFSVGITAIIVVFQPELRKALEHLGQSRVASIIPFDASKEQDVSFDEKTAKEVVKAATEMSKTKTGALIVIEQNILLTEYERTGIELDSLVSAQLLVNIFEHNTPLHDGAVVIRGNRIVSATCYLPLSDNMELSKDLGTRHRAGIGISEVADCITVIVSEETGGMSIAESGSLIREVNAEFLYARLTSLRNSKEQEDHKNRPWKGWLKNAKKTDK